MTCMPLRLLPGESDAAKPGASSDADQSVEVKGFIFSKLMVGGGISGWDLRHPVVPVLFVNIA